MAEAALLTGSTNRATNREAPLWQSHFFADLFLIDKPAQACSYNNLCLSLRAVRESLQEVVHRKDKYKEEGLFLGKLLKIFNENCEILDMFPHNVADHDRFHNFLETFMRRLKALDDGGILFAPVAWTGEGGSDYGALVVVHRVAFETEHDFNFTIINTNGQGVKNSGAEYHVRAMIHINLRLLFTLLCSQFIGSIRQSNRRILPSKRVDETSINPHL